MKQSWQADFGSLAGVYMPKAALILGHSNIGMWWFHGISVPSPLLAVEGAALWGVHLGEVR